MPEITETPKVDLKIKTEEKKVTFAEKKHSSLSESVLENVADPCCDEKNPHVITFQDVCQAAFMIKGGIDVTPCRVSK